MENLLSLTSLLDNLKVGFEWREIERGKEEAAQFRGTKHVKMKTLWRGESE
jgi:hypothetical protein